MTLSTTALIPDEGSPPFPYTLNVVDAAVPVRLPILPVERVSIIRFGDNVISPVGVDAMRIKETDDEAVSVAGPVLPAVSETELARKTVSSVPSEVHETQIEIDVPVAVAGLNVQPVAVPRLVKSEAVRPAIASPKLMM